MAELQLHKWPAKCLARRDRDGYTWSEWDHLARLVWLEYYLRPTEVGRRHSVGALDVWALVDKLADGVEELACGFRAHASSPSGGKHTHVDSRRHMWTVADIDGGASVHTIRSTHAKRC